MLQALSDLEAVAHDPGIRDFDTIYMTVPPSMPRLLDLPFPPSSSPCCPTNTGMLAPILPLACSYIRTPSDPEAITHDTDAQTFDSNGHDDRSTILALSSRSIIASIVIAV
jgi:hypothetical protein